MVVHRDCYQATRERSHRISVLQSVKKRKKNRKLGKIDVIRRKACAELGLDSKAEYKNQRLLCFK